MPRPFINKTLPNSYAAAVEMTTALTKEATAAGLTAEESELIKVRVSQLNGCAFCLDLHAREARKIGIPQQRLDLLPAWREANIYTERERAVLRVAEAATQLPLTKHSIADLETAQQILGDDLFGAAEWVAIAINAFNRISILSGYPVKERNAEGGLVRGNK